ncbi:hypothetical protein [Massilia endophytica]|uniref:hypothetical protein n=1 Tax=Massilia endophytica TaxID=2899220 RepID=UPI001E32E1BE|nr:hypothetical protein [Massilia endophytica]UGQ48899.1 hypothetical protein LSQ66_10675 [Massilia endophytica]
MKINACGQGGPFFAASDAAGLPLLFRTGPDCRLHLLRYAAGEGWRSICLSDALPDAASQSISCADVRQMADGRIALAVGRIGRNGLHSLHVAAGLAPGMGEEGWTAAMRAAHTVQLPLGMAVKRLDFGPLQAGAPPLLLVDAAECGHWYLNAAIPFLPLRPLSAPDEMQQAASYMVGSYRLPGLWAFDPGRDAGLRFISFPDLFGRRIDVRYDGLPPEASSFRLAAGLVPNVPDLFAAGERIVVYRGGNGVPQTVVPLGGTRLLWHAKDHCAEHLAYADRDEALWLVSRPAAGRWGEPCLLTQERAVLSAAADGGVNAFSVSGEWMRFGADGRKLQSVPF